MTSGNAREQEGARRPYVGLRAFRREDGGKFFGRERDSHDIYNLWRANSLTVLYGRSGVGKTSIVQAGVLPLLDPMKEELLPVGRVTPASSLPTAALPDNHNPHVFALLSSMSPGERPSRLLGMEVRDFLRRRPQRLDIYDDPIPTLMVIDQVEELFTGLRHRASIEQFVGQLVAALQEDAHLHLLLVVREDCLKSIFPDESPPTVLSQERELEALDTEGALEAITEPLRGTGLLFAGGAAEALVEDLAEIRTGAPAGTGEDTGRRIAGETVEALHLQVACSAMWRTLPETVREIDLADVRRYANVDGSLTDFCGEMIAEVARESFSGNAEPLKSWLQRTFITESGAGASVPFGMTETAGMRNAVVRALVDRHILALEERHRRQWCEIAHHRLIEPIRRANADYRPVEVPPDSEGRLHLAEIAYLDGEFDLAAKHAEEALRRVEDDFSLRARIESLRGDMTYRNKRYEEAVGHYEAAIRSFEMSGADGQVAVGELLFAVGRIRLEQKRFAEAVDLLGSAILRASGDLGLVIQMDLSRALWRHGNENGAKDTLDSVLREDGRTVEAIRLRGEILADRGEAEKALEELERVGPHPESGTRAAHALALALSGRQEEADREIADALADAGESGPVLLRAARVREIGGDSVAAALMAGRALRARDPELPGHLRERAERLTRTT